MAADTQNQTSQGLNCFANEGPERGDFDKEMGFIIALLLWAGWFACLVCGERKRRNDLERNCCIFSACATLVA